MHKRGELAQRRVEREEIGRMCGKIKRKRYLRIDGWRRMNGLCMCNGNDDWRRWRWMFE